MDRVSQRRACRVLGQPRSTQRYQSCRPQRDRTLLKEMRRISVRRPRFGCPRILDQLKKRGWRVNHKRVHRLWKQEKMQVPKKQTKRRRLPGHSGNGCIRHRPRCPDHVWSYDFVSDRTEDGRQLKLLVVIDEYTRESLAIEVDAASGPSKLLMYCVTCLQSEGALSSFAVTMDQNSSADRCVVGWHKRKLSPCTLLKDRLGKTDTSNRPTPAFVMNCSTESCS